MNFGNLTFDDHLAASAVVALAERYSCGSKREREEDESPLYVDGSHREMGGRTEECNFEAVAKKVSLSHDDEHYVEQTTNQQHECERDHPHSSHARAAGVVPPSLSTYSMPPANELRPFPFYYYTDHSRDVDLDPLTPLTQPGRVPNFPAKMHAILSRTDLKDIIAWMPHGRSWRVLKPREFEVRVVPSYFGHAKFSSFVRQANGWGFRRITQGRDRNSYYHPLFLRGLPHLCKNMKRPGVSEKQAMDPDLEPDLGKISEMYPVPEKAEDDSILLQCTVQGGPKARMPVLQRVVRTSLPGSAALGATCPMAPIDNSKIVLKNASSLTPSDQHALAAFQKSLGASESQLSKTKTESSPGEAPGVPENFMAMKQAMMMALPSAATPAAHSYSAPMDAAVKTKSPSSSTLAQANQMAFGGSHTNSSGVSASFTAASQFAAGFAAAAALSQQQFQAMIQAMQKQGLVPPQKATHLLGQLHHPEPNPMPLEPVMTAFMKQIAAAAVAARSASRSPHHCSVGGRGEYH